MSKTIDEVEKEIQQSKKDDIRSYFHFQLLSKYNIWYELVNGKFLKEVYVRKALVLKQMKNEKGPAFLIW